MKRKSPGGKSGEIQTCKDMRNKKNSQHISLAILLIQIIFAGYLCVIPQNAYGHPNKATHANEIMSAFGFEYNQAIYDWLCFISSDMIDKHQPFYNELCKKFSGFKCKHRLLFHWNYNGKPWTPGLEERVKAYTRAKYGSQEYSAKYPLVKEGFLDMLRKEQKKRNGKINAMTEQLFRFASSGKDASFANAFAALAYDLHLLGDYTSADNSDLSGLVEFNLLTSAIVESINKLDNQQGKTLIKKIKKSAKGSPENVQRAADDVMEIIQKELPSFLIKAQKGSIRRRLEKLGFKLREQSLWEKYRLW